MAPAIAYLITAAIPMNRDYDRPGIFISSNCTGKIYSCCSNRALANALSTLLAGPNPLHVLFADQH
jgi:hypothetical protein